MAQRRTRNSDCIFFRAQFVERLSLLGSHRNNTRTIITMLARCSALSTRRALAQTLFKPATTRALSTNEPKMHKATGKWDELKAARPIDHDDQHVRI